jgi:hypothetical protein
MQEKLCPLMQNKEYVKDGINGSFNVAKNKATCEIIHFGECIKEKCSFWNMNFNKCNISLDNRAEKIRKYIESLCK